jgi:hypothetical protein
MHLGDPVDPLGLHRPDPVDSGWMRRVRRGPVTVDQALAAGLARMLDEDAEELRQRDPVAYARARRPRPLWRRLLGRL